MEVREAESTATSLTVGTEGEKEAGKGFAAAIPDYGKAFSRSRVNPARGRQQT